MIICGVGDVGYNDYHCCGFLRQKFDMRITVCYNSFVYAVRRQLSLSKLFMEQEATAKM